MTTPIDELAGTEEPTTEAGRTLIADWGAGLIGELDLHTITDRIAAIETEARSTPVPASNVSKCVACFEPSHDIDHHDHHYHPLDATTYIGEAHSPVPASNVSGLYEDERALWEFIDHGKSPASNAAKGLDLPRCVVDHDHEADEGPCVYSVPASNVSEGPREAQRKIVSDWLMRGDETGKLSSDELLAALAHAAPEGLDRERQVAFLRRYEGSDGVGERTILFPGTAEDLLDRLSQPDATEEAGR